MKKLWPLLIVTLGWLVICQKPEETGWIAVNSTPEGAAVYLNDSLTDETTNCVLEVEVGEHYLELTLDDYEPWQGTVVVEEDKTTSIDVELTPSDSINDEFLWTFNADGRVYCCPAIGEDGTIYFVASTYLYALDPNGFVKWKYSAETAFSLDFSPAIGPDGTIYFSGDSSMYAVDPEGYLKWKYPTGGNVFSSPAIGLDSTIYFGSKDFNFYAITPQGELKWRYPTYDRIVSSPALTSGGVIYFVSEDHWLYALDTSGELKWKYPTGPADYQGASKYPWPGHSPAVGPNGQIYAVSGGDLYALSSSGGLLWKYDIDNISGSPVVGPDGTVYFCGEYYPYEEEEYYGVYALNPDGSLKWIEGPKIYSPTVASDSSINLPGYCLNPDGSTKWKSLGGGICSYCVNISPDGTIYYGLSTTLYALKSGSQGLANSSWPKFRGDAQNTGRVSF